VNSTLCLSGTLRPYGCQGGRGACRNDEARIPKFEGPQFAKRTYLIGNPSSGGLGKPTPKAALSGFRARERSEGWQPKPNPSHSSLIKPNQSEFNRGIAGVMEFRKGEAGRAGFRRDAGNCGRDDRAPFFTVLGTGSSGSQGQMKTHRWEFFGRSKVECNGSRADLAKCNRSKTHKRPVFIGL
jgi:hypothetical protein